MNSSCSREGCNEPVTRYTGIKTGKPYCTPCYISEYARENKESIRETQRQWIKKNPESFSASQRKYRASPSGRGSRREITREYQDRKRRSSPGTGIHREAMKEIYTKCPPGHEVDHIVPLNGKEVSGLHVPWNLQYLTVSANRRKGRKFV